MEITSSDSSENLLTQSHTSKVDFTGHAGFGFEEVIKLDISADITKSSERTTSNSNTSKSEMQIAESIPLGCFYEEVKTETSMSKHFKILDISLEGDIVVIFDGPVPGYDKKHHTFSNKEKMADTQHIQVKDIFEWLSQKKDESGVTWEIGKHKVKFGSTDGQVEWKETVYNTNIDKIPGFAPTPSTLPTSSHHTTQITELPKKGVTITALEGNVQVAVNSPVIALQTLPNELLKDDRLLDNWIKMQKAAKEGADSITAVKGNIGSLVNSPVIAIGNTSGLEIYVPKNLVDDDDPEKFATYIKQVVSVAREKQASTSSSSASTAQAHPATTTTTTTNTATHASMPSYHLSPLSQQPQPQTSYPPFGYRHGCFNFREHGKKNSDTLAFTSNPLLSPDVVEKLLEKCGLSFQKAINLSVEELEKHLEEEISKKEVKNITGFQGEARDVQNAIIAGQLYLTVQQLAATPVVSLAPEDLDVGLTPRAGIRV